METCQLSGMPESRQTCRRTVLHCTASFPRCITLLRQGLHFLGLALCVSLCQLRLHGFELAVQLLQESGLFRGGQLTLINHSLQLFCESLGLLPKLICAHVIEEILFLGAQQFKPRHLAFDVLQGGDPCLDDVQEPLLLPICLDMLRKEPLKVPTCTSEHHVLRARRLLLFLLLLLLTRSDGRWAADVGKDMHKLQVLARVMLEFELAPGSSFESSGAVVDKSDASQGSHEHLGKII
mmetsp:Transcript_48857/g.113244  ORF Transcript_48857/g.113244 Transcript_48857/m.113244 type:complete len:237 (-) Transcript_48857:265-975(-)